MIARLLISFLDMLRFQSGPQDLPVSRRFMLVVVAIYLGSGLLAGNVLEEQDYAARVLLAIGVQFTIIGLLLNFRGLTERLPQTIAALSGTGFLFGLMSLYLISLIDKEQPQAGLAGLYLLLFLWSLAVDGHIYRHALSSKMGVGVLVAVTIFTINLMLSRTVFG
ncbi:MAG: hypothetical protein KJN78_08905 [Gammaproteobacteria bacterium]|nr:hypothetical protein [Gammaproteobacteria bacterium]